MKKDCIVLVGPTAVGKTALAIQLAQHFNTQIISADSRQCYKELNIGVAKPSAEELNSVIHYFINSHSVNDEVNAAVYEQYALQKLDEIFTTNNTAIVVGGTGLYVKALCNGVDIISDIPITLRQNIVQQYEQHGMLWLQNEVATKDPLYYQQGEIENPQRLMRALEVVLHTSNSILSYQTKTKKERPFNIIKIGLQLPRDILYNRINSRVDTMLQQGLLKEVEALLPYKHLNALQTVGYTELFDYLDKKISLDRAIELIKQNTRHYAKRQITWFKKDEEINWVENNAEAFSNIVTQII
ncbi:MAG: tRNA (adenosine(37)-N6)-dimethylallyltransferase MiaA [Ferruginibacter sp.]|nr:tRNA (adenosine(37)-N6)-dimethylallyltransferase MiaA [Ferruginibacter sp.]